jgi:branched-chain amino acid transport system substrate-binding protein
MTRPAGTFLGCAVFLAAWLGGPVDAGPQPPLRIGGSVAQTGPYGLLGQNYLRGVRLCTKDANATGGILGRSIELAIEDDRSDPAVAVRIWKRLLTQGTVDALLGPYSSSITEAVADLAERHRMLLLPGATATSIFRKGRRFIFMVPSPAAGFLEGLIDLAARRGLKTVGIVHQDTLFPRASAEGTVALARRRGLEVVLTEAYPAGTTDFSAVLGKVRAANPDVLAAATYFQDVVAITRQMRKQDVNPKMVGGTVGVDLPKFYATLGRDAEFVYGASQWLPELATLRAGGLVPISRQYPGSKQFTETYRKAFPGADLSYHSAIGYAACQVLLEAIRRAGSLDGEAMRAAVVSMDLNTVFGRFKVDSDGVQIGHKTILFQWQDGQKVIVWPTELTPAKPRFPTPPWNER